MFGYSEDQSKRYDGEEGESCDTEDHLESNAEPLELFKIMQDPSNILLPPHYRCGSHKPSRRKRLRAGNERLSV